MVKLNVTIPAVDVMVNGQAYRKVDRKAQAGDIVKALYAREDITEGAFYAVYADGDGDPAFRDDDGDERCVFLEYRDRYETFAPVTPQLRPIQSRLAATPTVKSTVRPAKVMS